MYINKERFKKIINILAFVWPLVLNMFCAAVNKKRSGMFYVLLWTPASREPFCYWYHGNTSLALMNCAFQNCYITDNKIYFNDIMDFDVILFNAPDLTDSLYLPPIRNARQIYVFISVESEANTPISDRYNNFFNYTWSYKLNSDIPYPYFFVRNKRTGKVIAPKKTVHWKLHEKMKPAPEFIIERLQNKSICAAWFVTNCRANSRRLRYVRRLRQELEILGQKIDIFGACDANKVCLRDKLEECYELLQANYFFYLAFENSFSEDYVTEKLLTAVNNYAVPVVYGGANYSRFLPDGAYLNSRRYKPRTLAIMMNDIVKNSKDYYDYFKFYGYYTYHKIGESEDIDPLCNFCKFANEHFMQKERHVYENLTNWWHGKNVLPGVSAYDKMHEAYEQFMAEHPELRDFTTASTDSNMIIDILNYFFESRK